MIRRKDNWLDKRLPLINKLLLVAIVGMNLYIIVIPFLPQVTYRVNNIVYDQPELDTEEKRVEIDRSYNHLMIPKMSLDENIWIGDDEKLVNKGIWQIPHSSTPDRGSNTVLVGHRFSYKDAAVLYHLDKVEVGDVIVVAWDGKLYTYRVRESKIVKPTDVYVESATDESVLTIYTCHPIWSIKERLVVVSDLESVE